MDIKSLVLTQKYLDKYITINGWINNSRIQSNIVFISITDGGCQKCLQIVINLDREENDSGKDWKDSEKDKKQSMKLQQITKGVSIKAYGILIKSPAKGQLYELQMNLDDLEILGEVNAKEYPFAKKRHTLEHVRKFPHLRVRTNTISMVSRIRNTCSFATHQFFQEKGFINVQTPIITSNDCEGAGEAFVISNSKDSNGNSTSFFNKLCYLTVSGQLQAESYALGLSKVYTFGPTFRAEKSNTSRHLSEFWMVEPEICFISFEELMQLSEDYIKFCLEKVFDKNADDLDFINKFVSKGHKDKLHSILTTKFKRISYTEAVDILINDYNKKKPEYSEIKEWGEDLNSEQEKYLTSKFGTTVVYNYPKKIKSFYMKSNDDDELQTVQAMDILVPDIGELIGGSMREDDYDKLSLNMDERGINKDSLSWYLDLRKYGTAPHGGFGLGFERLIMLITGISNIRDSIPYPRYPKNCQC